MSWVPPIYDRSSSDYTPTLINGKIVNVPNNAKGFFNCVAGVTINGITSVDDWGRVYGNIEYINAEILTITGHTVSFTAITAPTTAKDPTTLVAIFNTLLANIEATRVYLNSIGASVTAIVTLVYTGGAGTRAPKYTDVNEWEYCLAQLKLAADAIHEIDDGAILWDDSSDILWDDSSIIDWSHIGV